jgi:glucose/arabinose dehydrogenase
MKTYNLTRRVSNPVGLSVPLFLTFIAFILINFQSFAQTPPSGFTNSTASNGYNQPVGMCFSTDGNRMWVWEKGGKVFVSNWVNGSFQKQASPVLDISEEVGNWLDHGMLGFAYDPNFDSNGYIYVSYVVDRHYLLYYGTGSYNKNSDDYKSATIGRITRYKINNSNGTFTADYTSRKILLGESKTTGIPILFETHGVGTLLFGRDGTLLASCGDGGGAAIDLGNAGETYYAQALTDGIIRQNENVGNFRAQMITSHSGKILRINPENGDGIPSNPFYDAANPRAVKSKVWAFGLRNPCRIAIKPGTGSYNQGDANPGELMIGDVGQGLWEEMTNLREGGLNCGWPIYEGIEAANGGFLNSSILNKDEPNPAYGQNGCTKQYFSFYNDLLREALPYTPGNPTVSCGTGNYTLPGSWKRYYHQRPVLDWHHARQGDNRARVPIFNGNTATSAIIGESGSNVTGERFEGNAAVGGSWYTGYNFPAEYRGAFFQGDYDGKWIRCFVLDANAKLTKVIKFIDNGANVVYITENFRDGCLYYVDIVSGEVRRISYGSGINNPPVAIASSNKISGNSPLTVQFTGNSSYDPDGGSISYEWDFGDGTAKSTTANPSHIFTAGGSIGFTATLKVTDPQGASSTATLRISLNNTAPTVKITNPVNNSLYPVGGQENAYTLTANVSDAESANSLLNYQWTISLRHNEHQHFEPVITTQTANVRLAAIGCDGDPYHYFIKLEVTDPAGLTSTDSVKLYPDCEAFLNVTNLASTKGNGFVNLTWTNSRNNYSEVMVVAKPANGINGLPAGNGSNYIADALYSGSGTGFDGGKVVYKGRGTSANITGLTNGTTYYFKIFTRINTYWTNGIQISNTPQSNGGTTITLNSLPDGATLLVNGISQKTPFIYESVQGSSQTIEATSSFITNNNTYNFKNWNTGSTNKLLTFNTPATNTTYTVNYDLVPNANNGTGLTGRYYNNPNKGFDTPVILTRTDATINFSWGTASPGTGVNADGFTARWTGQVLPTFTEEYTFYVVSDDGIRLWVNNVLLIDKWVDQGGVEWSGKINLNAGQKYDIKLEYYENAGNAVSQLLWSSAGQAKQIIPATQLFPENTPPTTTVPSIITQPVSQIVTEGNAVSFTLAATGSAPLSYQWLKNNVIIAGANSNSYSFTSASTDNGAKFKCVVSNSAGSTTSNEVTLSVNPPPSNPPSSAGSGLTANYFNQYAGFTSTPVLSRIDNNVNFDWALNAPASSVNPDNFSVRWTGQVLAQFSENYAFFTTSDDGVRLWVNNTLLIDKWVHQGGVEWNGTIALTAGQKYDIKLEYFEGGGNANCKLFWSSNNTPKQIIPSQQLFPENGTPPVVVAPSIITQPVSQTVTEGNAVSFTLAATGSAPLSYQWLKNNVIIAGANSNSYSFTSASTDNGAKFKCIVSNSAGSTTSNEATLSVNPPAGNTPPVATITQPLVSYTYKAGDILSFAGTGNDTEDGVLTAAKFTWWIDVHHESHVHAGMAQVSGITSGTYTIPRDHGDATAIFLRLYLKVTDSQGASTTTYLDIQPQWSTLTINSNPTAVSMITDNQNTIITPVTFQSVKGVTRTIEAPVTYTSGGNTYKFKNWSTGESTPLISFNTPEVNTSYTATYDLVPVALGTGLTARYFTLSNKTFTGTPALTRTDAVINFDWGQATPNSLISADNFTVRWTGKVQPQYTEQYTFYTTSDDGIRLWVNNVLLIDKWFDQGPNVEWTGKINLIAGQQYDIKVEYYDNLGRAMARVAWSSTNTAKQVVPTSQLFPEVSGGVRSTQAVSKEDFEELPGSEKILLYPIPTNNILYVRLVSPKAQQSNIQIHDPLGRTLLVKQEKLNEGMNEIVINTEHMKSGFYFLKLQLNEGVISKSFIKE